MGASAVPTRSLRGRSLRPALATIGLAGAVLAGVQVTLVLVGPFEPEWVAVLFAGVGLTHLGAGLAAWYRRPSNRTGPLLTLAGLIVLVAGLELSAVPALVAPARVLALAPIAMVVHLLLAFPSGRLETAGARLLAAAAYVICLVLEAPNYLLAPEPSGLLQVADRPGLVDVGHWVQGVAASVAFVAVAALLVARLRRATPAKRRALAPVYLLGAATVAYIPLAGNVLVRTGVDPVAIATTQIAALGVVPIAFALGVLRGGFARTGEIEELGAWLGAGERTAAGLRGALADTLGDPSVALLFWVPEREGYVDVDGVPAGLPEPGSPRAAVEISLAGRRVGAIAYDANLIADPEEVRAAGAVAAIALDRERLTADLLASRAALQESRDRVVRAADDERRRIARDLHDGLQAKLVLLGMRLGVARASLPAENPAREALDGLRAGLDDAVADLRALVHGVMPSTLVEHGLYAAVEDLVDRLPVPTALDLGEPPEGLSPVAESTAYFVVAEGLTNAVKHAGAGSLTVRLSRAGERLRIELADDGRGGVRLDGNGLRGIADRLEAVGGRLSVQSAAGRGTRLLAEVPCGS